MSSNPFGCTVTPLDAAECADVLSWLDGDACPTVLAAQAYKWALVHTDSGVLWGRFANGGWQWPASQAAEYCGRVTPATAVQQLRVFGPLAEVLCWRADGALRGRFVMDAPAVEEWQQPLSEYRVLVGDRVLCDAGPGFTVVRNAAANAQVVPFTLDEASFFPRQAPQAKRKPAAIPYRLHVCHHLAQDADTGLLRPALTRCVDLVYWER